MSEPEFLEADAVLFMHDHSIREFGGHQGVRDENLFARAPSRPQQKYHYAGDPPPDLFDLASAYAFGIARNHAFNDANKRTAWAACLLFLRVNGVRIKPPASESVPRMVALARGGITEEAFAAWLRVS